MEERRWRAQSVGRIQGRLLCRILPAQAIGRCLPNAAAALFHLKAWVGPERRVLVCAADVAQQVVVPTVVAAHAHWHCGESLESLQVRGAILQVNGSMSCTAVVRCAIPAAGTHCLSPTIPCAVQEQPALRQSADLRLIMDTGDLLLAANALVPGTTGKAQAESLRRDPYFQARKDGGNPFRFVRKPGATQQDDGKPTNLPTFAVFPGGFHRLG